jgi:hypothetical protein
MNKLLSEGKRLAEDAVNNYSTERLTDQVLKCVNYHLPHKLIEIYGLIEDMQKVLKDVENWNSEAINGLFRGFPSMADADIRHAQSLIRETLKKLEME